MAESLTEEDTVQMEQLLQQIQPKKKKKNVFSQWIFLEKKISPWHILTK